MRILSIAIRGATRLVPVRQAPLPRRPHVALHADVVGYGVGFLSTYELVTTLIPMATHR